MGEIYTAIDLGTNSIKIIVCKKHNNKFIVLASSSSESSGIKDGQIEDTKSAITSVKKAIHKASNMLGIKINKVIATIPATNCKMNIFSGSWDVIDYDRITGEDVRAVLKDSLIGKIKNDEEVITVCPIEFKVDDQENIKDPKGMAGKVLETKVVVSTVPKEPLYRILEVLKLSGLEVIDVGYCSTGDYYTIKTSKTDECVGAIINIGEVGTNISVFNKGIQIKYARVAVGSKNVDKDLSYIFKIDKDQARNIKETFAISKVDYADKSDTMEIITLKNEKKELSQFGASKVVEERIKEILNLAKNEIKNLTNREISYIIVTGGLSEIAGFQYLVEEILGVNAKVCNISTIGIRQNKYSSCYGLIKYFDDKLLLRGKNCDMMDTEEKRAISSKDSKINNDNIINRVFGHFFDN